MKNFTYSILAVMAIALFACQPVSADPTVTIKAGGWPGASGSRSAGVTHGFIYSVESTECGNPCLSGSLVHLSSSYGKNMGIGSDFIFKALDSDKGSLRFSLGAVRFEDRLNDGERNNAHIGAAFEIPFSANTRFVLSYDHYSNGRKLFNRSDVDKNVPSHLLTLGFRFR